MLTPARHDLLCHLRRSPAHSVGDLARALGRDAHGVLAGIATLVDIGLVARAEDGGLSSPFDAIMPTIHLAV